MKKVGIITKVKASFWSILFWIGVLALVIWALGKALGIIESPIWVEMIPYLGVGAALISGGIKAGRALQKLDVLCENVNNVQKDIKEIQRKAKCLHVN